MIYPTSDNTDMSWYFRMTPANKNIANILHICEKYFIVVSYNIYIYIYTYNCFALHSASKFGRLSCFKQKVHDKVINPPADRWVMFTNYSETSFSATCPYDLMRDTLVYSVCDEGQEKPLLRKEVIQQDLVTDCRYGSNLMIHGADCVCYSVRKVVLYCLKQPNWQRLLVV